MDLKIKDVADLLNVSETTIRRWLDKRMIPAYRINGRYHFNKTEIEAWLMSHKLGKTDEGSLFRKKSKKEHAEGKRGGGIKQFSLFRALHKGKVLIDVPGKTKDDIIRSTTTAMADEMDLDGEVLTELLLDRENLQPTALDNGIAVPHTRDFLLDANHDVVTIAFPKEPIDYGALDGQPVHTLFFLFASDSKRHLHLLAKIAHLSSQDATIALLRSKPSKEELLDYIKEWEASIQQSDD